MKNKKSILWAFLTLVVFCVGAIATGSSSSSDFVISDGVLTSYTGKDTTVYVPDGVTTISVGAFDDATISVIYLPTSVTTVENDSFALCGADVKVVFEMTSPTSALPSGMENWGIADVGGQITTYTTSGITTYTLANASTFGAGGSDIDYNSAYSYIKDGTLYELLDEAGLLGNRYTVMEFYPNSSGGSNGYDVSRQGDGSVRLAKSSGEISGNMVHKIQIHFDGERLVMPENMEKYFTSMDSTYSDGDVMNCEYPETLEFMANIYGMPYLDTSRTTNMRAMFYDMNYLATAQVNGDYWDTSNVTDLSRMFLGCKTLLPIVSGFDTSSCTNMSFMFAYCDSIMVLDLRHFDTSNVTDMLAMFYWSEGLRDIDVSSFDTSKVTNMSHMFGKLGNLESLNVTNFNTSSVENTSVMFNECTKLTELDLSSFDLSSVTNTNVMFTDSLNLTNIYARTQADADIITNSSWFPAGASVTVK